MTSNSGFPHENGVKVVARCVLKVVNDSWTFSELFAAEIDAHWQNAKASNPSYFNGVVYLFNSASIRENELHGTLIRTEFKSYLYWRSLGFPDAGVIDGFGSALIRTSDGIYMLVLQRPGNVNSGYAYLPSGFIDESDVRSNGTIDIGASVARELDEEIGEAGADLQREDGFIVTRSDAQLCIAVPYHVPMTADEFTSRVEQHIAACEEPELAGVVPAGCPDDLDARPILPYARALLEALFAGR